MLATAYKAHLYNKPVLGLNLGKLGFLVETDVAQMDSVIDLLKKKKYCHFLTINKCINM